MWCCFKKNDVIIHETKEEQEFSQKLEDVIKNNIDYFTFDGKFMRAKIVDVYDGDTCTIALEFNSPPFIDSNDNIFKFKLRMYGYDAPEMKPSINAPHRDLHKQAAKISKNFLKQYMNKIVYIDFMKEEKYGRLMGNMYLDSDRKLCVNDIMINNKLGAPYEGGTKGEFTRSDLEYIIEEFPDFDY